VDKKTGAPITIGLDQTPSDLDMSLEYEEITAIIKDDEVRNYAHASKQ
jgi:hypothetical protein